MSNEHKDYSLLRPFDLEAAKRGEAICRNEDGSFVKYIAGPDRTGLIVFDDNGEFLLREEDNLRMAPLCWVEGRPVYRGNVLYRDWGQAQIIAKDCDGNILDDEIGCRHVVDALTWTPPKVKREGFVVVNKASVFNSREQAEAYRDSFLENTGRFVICRAEWEEPAEVAK